MRLELLTPEEMAEADRFTIARGTSGAELMEAAGGAVAEVARRRRAGGSIVILVGPGNNGGDGWVAARVLRDAGYRVTVAFHGDRERIRGDARIAADRFTGEVVPATPEAVRGAGLIVDALYGAGVRLPLSAEALQLIEAVNQSSASVISVDLPSGVEGEGGLVSGQAVNADETVTFFRLKPGHLLMPGRGHCGVTRLVQIGITDTAIDHIEPRLFLNRPALWASALPHPQSGGHKYDRGQTLVVSGPMAATGAARMAATAALRAGSGLVSLASPPAALAVNASHLTAVMVRRMEGHDGLRDLLADARFNAVILGPGLGVSEATARLVETALRAKRQVVLDADALTSFSEEPQRLFEAIGRGGDTIITPHEGEFARLFPDLAGGSKLARARAAASQSGAIVLLKGADTVIAAPDGWAAINDNAPAFLATAGAGDVLAGMAAGLLAQGMPATLAAAAAGWIHGRAAALFGVGLTAEDLPEMIPVVLQDLVANGAGQSNGDIVY